MGYAHVPRISFRLKRKRYLRDIVLRGRLRRWAGSNGTIPLARTRASMRTVSHRPEMRREPQFGSDIVAHVHTRRVCQTNNGLPVLLGSLLRENR